MAKYAFLPFHERKAWKTNKTKSETFRLLVALCQNGYFYEES